MCNLISYYIPQLFQAGNDKPPEMLVSQEYWLFAPVGNILDLKFHEICWIRKGWQRGLLISLGEGSKRFWGTCSKITGMWCRKRSECWVLWKQVESGQQMESAFLKHKTRHPVAIGQQFIPKWQITNLFLYLFLYIPIFIDSLVHTGIAKAVDMLWYGFVWK